MLNSCVIILQNIAFDLLRESIVAKGRNLGRTGSSMWCLLQFMCYFTELVLYNLVKSWNFVHITDSFDCKKPVDPCSPKGYEHNVMTRKEKLTPTLVKHEQLSNLHATGNFSECRIASLSFLQKDKGVLKLKKQRTFIDLPFYPFILIQYMSWNADKCAYEKCYIGSTFIPKLEGKFLATENFFHTSKVHSTFFLVNH